MENEALSVTDVNRIVKKYVQGNDELKDIWVKGEISNLSRPNSGHIYFSMKDGNSVLRCTFFAFKNKSFNGKLEDGTEILANGSVTVYEAGGSYNLNITRVEDLGQGNLLVQIEKLKKELEDKGIFDPARKRPLPELPVTIGVATSATGAAIEDILRIFKERYPNVNVIIAPCVVQGDDAPYSIINAIEELNRPEHNIDMIIAGRGGGSYEDLMAFNHRDVVMAFYNSRLPIISAVGHQVDTVLTDFAADLACPTPTAAAEAATPDIGELAIYIDDLETRIIQSMKRTLEINSEKLKQLAARTLKDPYTLLADKMHRFDEVVSKIRVTGVRFLADRKSALARHDNLPLLYTNRVSRFQYKYELIQEKIDNFSPLLTLKRGYAVARTFSGKVVRSVREVSAGDNLEIILSDGKFNAEVKGD